MNRKITLNSVPFSDDYKKNKKEVNRKIIIWKQQRYKNITNNSDNLLKTVWNIVNSIRGKVNRDSTIREIYHKNKLIWDSKDVGNIFGIYVTTDVSEKKD